MIQRLNSQSGQTTENAISTLAPSSAAEKGNGGAIRRGLQIVRAPTRITDTLEWNQFLGSSTMARKLAAKIPRLAASEVGILLEGETGVGKTFVARHIHQAGRRAREPLRVINCGAIPENLLESELFGHERGAFTGAVGPRIGAFEAAGHGTIFLDEIGEMSLTNQAKLLHVLEARSFERIGSNKAIPLNARVICATNRDLDRMSVGGDFRRDLLFRVAVLRVRVPSLRERREDLADLARQLLADAIQSAGARIIGFSPDAMAIIEAHSWPGNVRELRNAVEYAVALGEGPLVRPEDLPPGLLTDQTLADQTLSEDPDVVRLPLSLAEVERRTIAAALRHTKGNKTRAAALLGISRPTLNARLSDKP